MNDRRYKPSLILLLFLLCAAADFGWGYLHSHSVAAAIFAAILGVFGTAFYAILMLGPGNSNPK